MYLLPIFATQTATLGAGNVKLEGTVINLATVNSNMTLLGDIVADDFGNAGNGWLINGTLTPPSLVVGSPYNYSSTLQQTNITGIASTELNLNVSTVTILTGVEIWGTQGVLSAVAVTDTVSVTLSYTTGGNTTVYAPSSPLAVVVNGTYYADGSIWDWDSASSTALIQNQTNSDIRILFAASGWTSHNVFIREEVFGEAFDSPGYYNLNVTLLYDNFRLTYTNDTNILVWGEPLIIATVTSPAGTQYYRTLIPSAATQYMYIPDIRKYSITLFTIQLIDLPDLYDGAIIRIYSADREIASGYIDASFQFGVYLIDGSYFKLDLTASGSTITAGYFNAVPTQTTVQVTIGNIIAYVNQQARSSVITWSALWSGANIVMTYTDLDNDTTSVQFTLYEANATAKRFLPVFDQTYLMNSSVIALYAGNTSHTYFVRLISAQPTYGGLTETRPVERSNLGVSMPNLPVAVMGLNLIMPNVANAWVYLLSMVIVILTAFIFGALYSGKGAIVVAVIGLLLSAMGWLPITFTYAVAALAIAVVNVLARERGD